MASVAGKAWEQAAPGAQGLHPVTVGAESVHRITASSRHQRVATGSQACGHEGAQPPRERPHCPQGHQHMSWAHSAQGHYTWTLGRASTQSRPIHLGHP